ncbi:unnamed protein product [Phytophthora fragariaefolia]|uniref:Unnamed protein product n=1 Tax=Phytophthora fragariaefolia TaxID=1490495 RepID=A0A9W7CI74_9STRA|nr:unnamed protein product [Phytophthora fragariaefolia]
MDISGQRYEVDAKWHELDGSTTVMMVIKHCSMLDVPDVFNEFHQLISIKVYNSTIVNWSDSAAITNTNHPKFLSLMLVRVNMTDGLLPAGFQSSDLPLNLYDFEFCLTNLQELPDDLDLNQPPMLRRTGRPEGQRGAAQGRQGSEESVGSRRSDFWNRCSRRAPSVQERLSRDRFGWAGVSMSAESKLGLDNDDKSVPDASAQASVGCADVVEPPVGGRVSDPPNRNMRSKLRTTTRSNTTKRRNPRFGPADDVEVVEVGPGPDDDDDEVELVKVEPAVKKEAHLSMVQEDQVLEDIEVSSLKSSGTASIRTPVQARLPPVLPAQVQGKHMWPIKCADGRGTSPKGVSPQTSSMIGLRIIWIHRHIFLRS